MRQAYIAGPYTANTPEGIHKNIGAALRLATMAAALGWEVILPHTMGPHREITWEDAMIRCRELVRGLDPARDCVVLVPGWDKSRGALEEVDLAEALGIPIFGLVDLPLVDR